ncbi:hypothetical protein [Nocardioides marmoribigeumensis]|uniref:Uncharacterized protein n=1 Tax=Nocardioides marmoribigeumensis TaxID=433649 RepID=A0ABU2C0D2_9ACTN|nr:hypothetical protein [Nocardioides marmoribigeumensis]MDR7364069.1 hypothetical protein [Nocardioides marmoribigeumensis]
MCRQCESGAEAAESYDVLAEDDLEGLTPEQRERAAATWAESPTEATRRATQALRDDR